jgi:SAM-dependent methyltransferase
MEALEISDAIVAVDPVTLDRRPVARADVLEAFRLRGDRRALRIVERLPHRDGLLEPAAVDRLLLTVHAELQRISEEFEHGQRVAELLRPLLATLRAAGVPAPLRVVDIGCGTGYVLRWLAAYGQLGDDVALVGVDLNEALVEEAQRLAEQEGLAARFLKADAFRLPEDSVVYLSTGVLHHFRDDDLTQFVRSQDRPGTHAFLHFDFQPSPLAVPGAWVFHLARMREPLSRHDGVLSAQRAHDAGTLTAAARVGAPRFRSGIFGARLWGLPIPRVFHTLVGLRPELADGFGARLGRRRGRLQWA